MFQIEIHRKPGTVQDEVLAAVLPRIKAMTVSKLGTLTERDRFTVDQADVRPVAALSADDDLDLAVRLMVYGSPERIRVHDQVTKELAALLECQLRNFSPAMTYRMALVVDLVYRKIATT